MHTNAPLVRIVDDDEGIRNSMAFLLEGEGWEVKTYRDGSQFLASNDFVRPGCIIADGVHAGNFVEIKNSNLGDGVKVAHLTYVGDADIGDVCNIGCGVVFCNYNGEIKQRSVIEKNVFIGSNVNIIAPVKIEEGAYIAAGSTINKNVGKNQFAIAREFQINKDNFKNPYLNKLQKNLKKQNIN